MRAIFFGTPEIAIPALSALNEIAEIVGIVCQPDRPAGRGLKMRAPAVKSAALAMGLEPFQPLKVRDGALTRWVREREADVALVIAYGRILDANVLNAPRLGCVNLHASLLPKYRGAAPIQRVIMAGEDETGVCLMKMDEGMDTGDILACHRISLAKDESTGTLAEKVGHLAGIVTTEELPRYVDGTLLGVPQMDNNATYARPITALDTPLDFERSAPELSSQIRGLAPRPGAAAFLLREETIHKRVKILKVATVLSPLCRSIKLKPGELRLLDGAILVGTASSPLQILSAQLEGKKVQSPQELINGRLLRDGDYLRTTDA